MKIFDISMVRYEENKVSSGDKQNWNEYVDE